MTRANRVHLLWLVIVVVLAATVWWSVRRQAATAAPETLLPIAVAAVERIQIDTREGVIRRFVKRDGQWHMLAPHQGLANQAHLARLARLADARVARWRPVSDFDLAKLGLAEPWATLQLNGQALAFGSLSALAPQRYVRVGDHVALIAARYAGDIKATPDSELARAGSTLPTL